VDKRRRPAPAASAWAATTVAITVGALGGAAWLAPRTATPGAALALLLFVGSSVHVAATAWIGTLPEVRSQAFLHPFRFFGCPVLLIAAATGAALVLPPHVLSRLLLGYFGWQLWHYQRQNLGFVALAACASGVTSPTRWERRVINAAGAAGVVSVVSHPAALQLGVPAMLGWAWPLAAGSLVASIGVGAWFLIRRPRSDRSPAFVGLTAMALLFPIPLFVFSSPFAALGGITIAHGLQYLVFVGTIAAGHAGPGRRVNSVAAMLVVALSFGAALAAASHLHNGGTVTRSLYGAYLGLVMTHFVVDAGTWRLRDPLPRQLLSRCVPSLVRR
jgi:hypothetical protein